MWVNRGQLNGDIDWVVSDEISSDLIRLRWNSSPAFLWKALVARVRIESDGNLQFYGIKRIWSQPNIQIIDFNIDEPSLENARVAFKVLTGKPSMWNLEIDGWNSPDMERRLIDVTQNELVNNKVIIQHNLDADYVSVDVYDDTRTIITPYSIREVDGDSVEIDFTDLTPLQGIWKVSIRP